MRFYHNVTNILFNQTHTNQCQSTVLPPANCSYLSCTYGNKVTERNDYRLTLFNTLYLLVRLKVVTAYYSVSWAYSLAFWKFVQLSFE